MVSVTLCKYGSYILSQFNFSGIRDFNNKLEAVRAWYLRKCPSVLVMGYEAYETLTNELKLQKTSSKTKKIVLRALVDPGKETK